MAQQHENGIITNALAAIPHWNYSETDQSISQDLTFKDFTQAWEFMQKVAVLAEQANHHPDWSNSYNKVSISLTTHSKKQLTQKDITLAKQIDGLINYKKQL